MPTVPPCWRCCSRPSSTSPTLTCAPAAPAPAALGLLASAGRFAVAPPCPEPLYQLDGAGPTGARYPLARYVARRWQRPVAEPSRAGRRERPDAPPLPGRRVSFDLVVVDE